MLRQDHRQLDKHFITQIIQPIVKMNPVVSIKMLIAKIKMFMKYTPSYKENRTSVIKAKKEIGKEKLPKSWWRKSRVE